MPRFVALPVVVSAYQYFGNVVLMPDSFRMAVRRYHNDGTADVMTGDGLRPCRHGDWLVHGPDGQFTVMRPAVFEMMFAEQKSPPTPATDLEPPAIPARRSVSRKEAVNG